MKKFFLSSTFLLFGFLAFAQINDLTQFNADRLRITKTGMTILGGWAMANVAAGAIFASQREGVDKAFHQMNLGWGAVNLAIAGFGYYTAMKTDPASFDLYSSIQEQHKLQKILLFNAGLDVGYMLGGLYLIERSKNDENNRDRLKGFGRSIILQGAFLFAFDVGMAVVLSKRNPDLQPLLGSLQVTGDGLGLVLNF